MAVMPEVKVRTYDRKSADSAKAKPNYLSNHWDFDYNPESRLHYYQATMAINNQYVEEVVNGATNCQQWEIVVSKQPSPTDKSKTHLEAVYHDTY